MPRQCPTRVVSIITACILLIARINAIPIQKYSTESSSSALNNIKEKLRSHDENENYKVNPASSSEPKVIRPRLDGGFISGIATTVIGSAISGSIAPIFNEIGNSLIGGGASQVLEQHEANQYYDDQFSYDDDFESAETGGVFDNSDAPNMEYGKFGVEKFGKEPIQRRLRALL